MPSIHYEVLAQPWVKCVGLEEESDGYSLHLNYLDKNYFIQIYRNSMPSVKPYAYSIPRGEPRIEKVDEQTYEMIERGRFGIRCDKRTNGNGIFHWVQRPTKKVSFVAAL